MSVIRWELYPLVAASERPRAWLQMQEYLQLAPKTLDAYGRCLDDFLDFSQRSGIAIPEAMTREQVTLYVHDLAHRPNPKGRKILSIEHGQGLANATMQQRITVLRLFCDALVELQVRQDNPVGRGHYVPGKAFGGVRDRKLLPHYHKLPWLPNDDEWQTVLRSLQGEPLRNQVMLLLAYEGALRREELVTLETQDFDFAYRQIRVRAEQTKNRRGRVVGYGEITSKLLETYLRRRRQLSSQRGPVFLSESHRNIAHPLAPVSWSKVVQRIAEQTSLPHLTTHTLRHLRLTHMARAHMELHQIALYAGHASLQTTMLYIHLSGAELTDAVKRSLAGFEQWLSMMLGETQA